MKSYDEETKQIYYFIEDNDILETFTVLGI